MPETAVSLDNNYYTFKGGSLYLHHDNQETNNFYGIAPTINNGALSSVTEILNDIHG